MVYIVRLVGGPRSLSVVLVSRRMKMLISLLFSDSVCCVLGMGCVSQSEARRSVTVKKCSRRPRGRHAYPRRVAHHGAAAETQDVLHLLEGDIGQSLLATVHDARSSSRLNAAPHAFAIVAVTRESDGRKGVREIVEAQLVPIVGSP